jgi:ATP-dependent Lon protease
MSYNLRNKKLSKKEKKMENETSSKNRKLKKNHSDDGDDDIDIEFEDDDDEEDTEYETESETNSNEDGSEDSDCDVENDEDDENEDETSNKSKKVVRSTEFSKLLASIFPSKFSKEKAEKAEKAEKVEKTEKNKKDKLNVKEDYHTTKLTEKALDYTKKTKRTKHTSKDEENDEENDKLINELLKHLKNKKNKTKEEKPKKHKNKETDESEESNEEEESDDSDSTENDEDYDPKKENKQKKTPANDIYMTITYGEDYEGDEDIDKILNIENDECDSEDEKTFMSDVYEKVEDPPTISKDKTKKKSKKLNEKSNEKQNEKSKKHIKSKNGKPQTPEKTSAIKTIEQEYKELISLKKQLTEKLQQTPNSKILKNAIIECNKEIKQLVIQNRRDNTEEYYNLSNNSESKNTGELEYFKTKLSNKEQLKIMEDLHAINEHIQVVKPYKLTLLQSNLPAKYKATVMQKLNMLQSMEPGDNEYHKLKSWIDTFMRIPFNGYKDLSISINDGLDACNTFMNNAKKTLDDCTYGLDDAKMQILQLIGQWLANPTALGTAIAIYGPKGTGKTSLAKEGISKIFGREFAFISLGGSGDSSYLEGHSYTYEGSTWGKIVQILIESKCMNPIIYFDELDKISDSSRGQEITGILTHLTDSTQNNQFRDKYFSEVEFDLSRCLFIFSYNDENAVNPILRDRMYRIQTKGYDVKEKTIIAKKYLLPKIREQVNFKEGDIVIPDDVIHYIVSNEKLTQKEEGVRNLKRCLEIIHTKLNLFRLIHNTDENSILGKNIQLKVEFPYTVTRADVDILIKNEEKQNQSLLSMYV